MGYIGQVYGGSSGSGGSTSTVVQQPPAYVLPYLQQSALESQRLYGQGPAQYYPGRTVTPFSSQTQQALDLTQQRATAGSPVTRAAQGYTTGLLNNAPTSQFGGASNPYLDATFNRAADRVQNRLQTSFAGTGRNIKEARPLAAQEMNDLATGIYGGAYESERSRMASDLAQQRGLQFSAAQLAPNLAAQDYADLSALQGVGAQYEDLDSRQLADSVARHDYAQSAPGLALDQYIARLNNQPGGSTSSTVPYHTNRGASMLGGAALGYGLGSQFGYGGWGAAAGGLLGAFG
jgi:hypothetical protein